MVLDASLLTLSIKRYGSRIKWSNPGKGVEKGVLGPLSITVTKFTYLQFIYQNYYYYYYYNNLYTKIILINITNITNITTTKRIYIP